MEPDRAISVSHDSGLGRSKDAVAPAPVGQPAPAAFLKAVSEALGLGPAVVISPSLSGMYSLPFLLEHSHLFKAYVPVAPICTEKFTAEQYAQIKVWPGRTLGRSGNGEGMVKRGPWYRGWAGERPSRPETLLPLKKENVMMKECKCEVVGGKEGTVGDPGV